MRATKSTAVKIEDDVVIVGGGHAGCTMAALLASHNVSVICIDQDDPAATLSQAFDGRTTAISFGSQRVIAAAGAWEQLEYDACPIRDIKIMESGSPVLLEFLVNEIGSPALGWILENRKIRQSLYQQLRSLPLAQHIAPAKVIGFTQERARTAVNLSDGRSVFGKIIIGADGRNSFTREWMGICTRGWKYNQRALVCVVTHEKPHKNTAIEDFRSEGPFAILPMMDDEKGLHRSSIVWTEHSHDKDSALYWNEASFNAALNERFPDFYGVVELSGKRFSYPLGLTHAQQYTAPRMALVADAAHAIHPIAGQGLNMGFRDIAALSELIIEAVSNGKDPGSPDLLQAYENSRRMDNMAMAGATDSLNRLFSNDIDPVRAIRKLGLRAVQKIPQARRFFMKQAMGASGLLPELIRSGKFRSAR